jgi:hypothetical protein
MSRQGRRPGARTVWTPCSNGCGRRTAHESGACSRCRQLDATMREQLATDPEAGGPRDPAIGPHPRFREMDARRELRLRGQPIPPELADTDPQRSPRGWQGGDA